jgi:hypothetical protein
MSDVDLVALAALFQDVPRAALLAALASVLPLCEAHGILKAEQVRPILAMIADASELPRDLVGIPVDELFHASAPSRADEIDALYGELHALASSDGADTAHYRDRLARLRSLQEEEARDMAQLAEHRRQLPKGAAAAALRDIDALLSRHESPPGSNEPGSARG